MLKRVASHWPRDFCALHRAKRLQIPPLCSLQAYVRSNAYCVVGAAAVLASAAYTAAVYLLVVRGWICEAGTLGSLCIKA